MFRNSLRADHEPKAEVLLRLLVDANAGRINESDFRARLVQIFDALDLDLNVSQINGFIMPALVSLYPDARYILTIRDCRSWLYSFVNYQLTMSPTANDSAWPAFRDLRFRPRDFPHTPQDAALEAAKLYSLDAYLAYWLHHNRLVIMTAPPENLLIVPMQRLAPEANRIAAFLGLPPGVADLRESHAHAGLYQASPVDGLDMVYLDDKLAEYEGKLIEAVAARVPKGALDAMILEGR